MTGLQKRRRRHSPQSTDSYYPIYLDLKKKRCIIVGGGKIAERKCLSLIKNGADVTVISPDITKRLEYYRDRGKIKHIPRLYRKGDLKSSFLVIAATDSEEINRKIYAEAKDKNILLNVVDNPELCSFIVPSVFEQGDLKIAISTCGSSPAFSKRIRKELKAIYNPEFSRYLNFIKKIRDRIKSRIKNRKEREDMLKYLASEEIFDTLRKDGFEAAKKRIVKFFNRS